jgi:flagellar basal-body rod protein FlgG
MKAQQLNVDNIAHNLANVNTTGFKKSRVEFQDLFYQQRRTPGTPSATGVAKPSSVQIGYGATPVATQRSFSQGEMLETSNPTDLAIMGDGFFRVLMPDGSEAYTRDGSFKITADGQLMTSDGFMMDPGIAIPEGAQEFQVSQDGMVSVTVGGDPFPQIVGQIELVRFVNASGLKALGQNLYAATPASGEATTGTPGIDGFGRVTQGYLEVSNVEIVEEMIALIAAQRAYEINSRAIRASEEMMQMANDLTR